jgi:hypothetical protein
MALPLPVLSPFFAELDLQPLNGALVGVSTTAGPQTGCVNFNTPLGGSASPCSLSAMTPVSVFGNDSKDFTFPGTGTIKNIQQGTSSVISWEVVQAGTLDGGSGANVFFDLTGVPAAVVSGTNDCISGTVGSQCAPPGSPFVFHQIGANQVQIGFVVNAIAYTIDKTGGFTPYTANFSTTLNGSLIGFGCSPAPGNDCTDTIPNILQWEASGGSIESGWTATESPTVPEPLSFVLFGSGVLALALGRRKRRA